MTSSSLPVCVAAVFLGMWVTTFATPWPMLLFLGTYNFDSRTENFLLYLGGAA